MPATPKTAKQAGLAFLSSRMRSVQEVRDNLSKAAFPPAEIEGAIADLTRLKLLDDDEYARRWIESRLRDKRPAGKRKFLQDLGRKGIEAERLESVLQEYKEQLESDAVVVDLLRRQSWRYRGLDELKVKRRMLGYLCRRGYDRDLANRAAGQIWQEIRDNEIAGD